MTITIPDTSAGLAEALGDAKTMKKLLASKDDMQTFIEGYAAKADRSEEISKQVAEQTQLELAKMLNAGGGNVAAPPVDLTGDQRSAQAPVVRGLGKSKIYNRYAQGVKADGVFQDSAEFFRAAWHRASTLRDYAALSPKLAKLVEIQNSYGSEVPADGGFLIPEILRSEILQMALEDSIVRSRATVIPMSSLRVPIPMIDDTSHVSSILGGVTAYWTEEAATLTESQASFGRVVLDAKKLTAFASVPNELLQDAPAFSGFFDTTFPKAIAYFEDVAFLNGVGVGEPQGVTNSPAIVTVAKETGQTTQTIVWENVVKMYSRMLPTSLNRAVWVVSPDTFPQLATMALAVGTGGGPVWIGNYGGGMSGQDAPPATILGRPVIVSEKVSALGTAGDINFIDFGYYLIGDRMQMQTSSSEHFQFGSDKTAFRVIERVDGRGWLQSALTPHNNSTNTLSPFVQLASR